MRGVSDTRSRILDFIRGFLDERGYAPTVRDIVKGCNISSSSVVQYHLNVLEEQGHIRRDPEVFRSIRLSGQEQKTTVRVPVLGFIAAGEPVPVPTSDTWSDTAQEVLELSPELTQGEAGLYALTVKGTSMIDALVDDGDIVLMRKASTADDGEMVAAWLKDEQEVTLKRIYHEPGRIRLQPANGHLAPIYEPPENVEIQGRVVGVIRKLG